MLLPLFHLSVVAFNTYSLYYDQFYLDLPLPDEVRDRLKSLPFRGRILFLTMWGLAIQTAYFTLALLNDISGSSAQAGTRRPPLIRLAKDALFSLAFPLALFVSIAFWGIYAYDSELILPIHIRQHFPVWLNHAMHTTIVPFIFLELIMSPITYPPKPIGLTIGLCFIISYVGVLISSYLRSGSLVYKVMDVMSGPMKIAFITISAVFGISLYFLGDFLSGVLNPRDSGKKSSGKKPPAGRSSKKKN